MLVVGAGGLAAQMLDELMKLHPEGLTFFSETPSKYSFFSENFPVVSDVFHIPTYLNDASNQFILAVGGVQNRIKLIELFRGYGGHSATYISPSAAIGKFIQFAPGVIVLAAAEIESGAIIGANCLINKYAKVAHGCILEPNCEIAPDAVLTGDVSVGEGTYIGTRALILPRVKIGRNVSIGAGAIVKRNIPDNAVVSGEYATVRFFKKPDPQDGVTTSK